MTTSRQSQRNPFPNGAIAFGPDMIPIPSSGDGRGGISEQEWVDRAQKVLFDIFQIKYSANDVIKFSFSLLRMQEGVNRRSSGRSYRNRGFWNVLAVNSKGRSDLKEKPNRLLSPNSRMRSHTKRNTFWRRYAIVTGMDAEREDSAYALRPNRNAQ